VSQTSLQRCAAPCSLLSNLGVFLKEPTAKLGFVLTAPKDWTWHAYNSAGRARPLGASENVQSSIRERNSQVDNK